MSGVFKSIGKVFKKVVKVVKKVAVPALIIGAVVLTGGAALGALPALGTVLGSVGITGTMASVLGGAISSAAIGAVSNAAMAAATGGNIWKAGVRGGVMGAVTGGIGGGLGLISPNGVLSDMGIGSQGSHIRGLLDQGVALNPKLMAAAQAKGIVAPTGTAPPGFSATAFDPAANTASIGSPIGTPPAQPASQGLLGGAGPQSVVPGSAPQGMVGQAGGVGVTPQGGLLGQVDVMSPIARTLASTAPSTAGSMAQSWIPSAITAGGQLLSGFAQGAAAGKGAKAQAAEARDQYGRISANYGYAPTYARDGKGRISGNSPTGFERIYEYGEPKIAPFEAPFEMADQVGRTPFFQIVNGQVVSSLG